MFRALARHLRRSTRCARSIPTSCTIPRSSNESTEGHGRAELRVADKITAFAGSMNFVYLHVALFAVWMLVFEKSPWPTLTLAVSLEAIFLSTFVMIGQNRQASFQQAESDHDYQDVNTLLVENTNLARGRSTT